MIPADHTVKFRRIYVAVYTRHMNELNTVRESAQHCEELLKDKRERKLCE